MSMIQRGDNMERGVVAVELAIILPLLALLLVGTFEVGLLARDHQVLQNAAREGARFSSLPENRMDIAPSPSAVETLIKDRVIAYAANEGITLAASDVTVDQEVPMTIGGLTVEGSEVVAQFNKPLLFGFMDFLGNPVTLRGDAVFRNFY